MSDSKKQDEFRAAARIDRQTKERLDKIADNIGVTTSDVIRIGINVFLPQFESGKLDIRKLLKKAA